MNHFGLISLKFHHLNKEQSLFIPRMLRQMDYISIPFKWSRVCSISSWLAASKLTPLLLTLEISHLSVPYLQETEADLFSTHTELYISNQAEEGGFQMQRKWSKGFLLRSSKASFPKSCINHGELPTASCAIWFLGALPTWAWVRWSKNVLPLELLLSLLIPSHQHVERNNWSLSYIFSNDLEIIEIKDTSFAHEIWGIQARLIVLLMSPCLRLYEAS